MTVCISNIQFKRKPPGLPESVNFARKTRPQSLVLNLGIVAHANQISVNAVTFPLLKIVKI